MLVAPGVGTIGGGFLGAEAGATGGAFVGTGLGAATGYLVGQIVCSSNSGAGGGSAGDSTGRTTPRNLKEQLAMEQAKANPRAGTPVPLRKGMTDIRWPGSQGWQKMAQNINGVEIHYVYNVETGVAADFKFVF